MNYIYKQLYISGLGKPVTITMSSNSLDGLISKVFEFRQRKNLAPKDLPSVRREVTAKHKTKNQLINKSTAVKPRANKLTLQQAMLGAKALVKVIQGDVVSDAELQRRAEVCARCPKISDTSTTCSTSCAKRGLARFARNLAIRYGRNFTVPKIMAIHTRPVKTASLSEFYCGVCSCSCLNLCLSKSKNFLAKEDADLRPDHCWAKPNGINWKP
jgi:hypothetical protein